MPIADRGCRSHQKPSEKNKLASLVERDESPGGVQLSIDTVLTSPCPPPHSAIPPSPSPAIPSAMRTPQTASRPMPSFRDMHPEKVHPSTTSKVEAAVANQAMDIGRDTIPPDLKQSLTSVIQQTPTKVQGSVPSHMSSPGFDFSVAGSESGLSSETQTIMNNVREQAARIKARMGPSGETGGSQRPDNAQMTGVAARRIATPKGKSGRYSDAHKAEFRKMDSIANHPSTWKSKIQPSATSRKRSNSKANLDECQPPVKLPQSASTPSLSMYGDLDDLRDRTHAKRVKQNRDDDASHAPPPLNSTTSEAKSHILTQLPSAMTTPTQASLARAASTKHHSASKIPSLPRTQSSYALGSPAASKTEGHSKYFSSLSKMTPLKSILQRRENKLAEVAASLRPTADTPKEDPTSQIPQRTPTAKRVNFTSSTKERHALEEIPSHPTTPTHQTTPIMYPDLPSVTPPNVTQRPIKTLRPPSSAPTKTRSRPSTAFTFAGDSMGSTAHQPSFGFGYASPRPGAPKTPMTIRTVRPSGITTSKIPSFGSTASLDPIKMPGAFPSIPHGMSNKKRRRSEASVLSSEFTSADEVPLDQGNDKENLDPVTFGTPSKMDPSVTTEQSGAQYIARASACHSSAGEGAPSPAKKIRTGPSLYRQGEKEERDAKKANTPATRRLQKKQAAKTGMTPGKKVGGMTLSRLSALAKPKDRH